MHKSIGLQIPQETDILGVDTHRGFGLARHVLLPSTFLSVKILVSPLFSPPPPPYVSPDFHPSAFRPAAGGQMPPSATALTRGGCLAVTWSRGFPSLSLSRRREPTSLLPGQGFFSCSSSGGWSHSLRRTLKSTSTMCTTTTTLPSVPPSA